MRNESVATAGAALAALCMLFAKIELQAIRCGNSLDTRFGVLVSRLLVSLLVVLYTPLPLSPIYPHAIVPTTKAAGVALAIQLNVVRRKQPTIAAIAAQPPVVIWKLLKDSLAKMFRTLT
jgi:hypothetical protein